MRDENLMQSHIVWQLFHILANVTFKSVHMTSYLVIRLCVVVWSHCLWVVFCQCPVSFSYVHKSYSLIKLWMSKLSPSHIPSTCSFLKTGQWTVTHSMIVSDIVKQQYHLVLNYIGTLVWPNLNSATGK